MAETFTAGGKPLLGAIAGDIVGSIYEHQPIKSKNFPLFDPASTYTDDTVLTVAVAEAILSGSPYGACLRRFAQAHPHAGYGKAFARWLSTPDPLPYGSWGNGSAMRVSPIGFAFDSEAEVLRQARLSADVTHNHPEGIKGAQATALAVFLARNGADKQTIKTRLQALFYYDLSRSLDDIRPAHGFDVSCQGTVPAAMAAFFAASSYEDTLRNAVSLGGDSDTLACISGAVAEAFYGAVPEFIVARVRAILTPDLWCVTEAFITQYKLQNNNAERRNNRV